MTVRQTVPLMLILLVLACGREPEGIPDRTVVLTFDDASVTHRRFVAPLLKERGFSATFFITARWASVPGQCMSLEEVAELHEMGFEIGNHGLNHFTAAHPSVKDVLPGDLAGLEEGLARTGVPMPVSYAYPGDGFSPGALEVLTEKGYRFARRGAGPEVPWEEGGIGPVYDPTRHHPLLVPTAATSRGHWTMAELDAALALARPGVAVVFQFHGVPSTANPEVSTPPERFVTFLDRLTEGGYRVLALRDLEPWVDRENLPEDPLTKRRYP